MPDNPPPEVLATQIIPSPVETLATVPAVTAATPLPKYIDDDDLTIISCRYHY